MRITHRNDLLVGIRIGGGISMFLGATDEIVRLTTGVSAGLGPELLPAGGGTFLALGLLPHTPRVVRDPTEPSTPSPQ